MTEQAKLARDVLQVLDEGAVPSPAAALRLRWYAPTPADALRPLREIAEAILKQEPRE